MLRILAAHRIGRAAAFLALAFLAVFASPPAISQAVEQPAVSCGMGHQRLCQEVSTCIGIGGFKRCTVEYRYYNPA